MADPTVATDLEGNVADDAAQDEAVIDEVLVEEVSIDGMCGVY